MITLSDLKKQPAMLSLALGIAVILVYIPTLGGGFSWDEKAIFSDGRSEYYVEFFESSFTSPMSNALFGFEGILWGDNAWPFHIVNLLLHLLNAAAIYVLCVKLTDNQRAGAMAAAIFALYPGCTEAVSWIWGRAELFKALFFNVAFISYIEYRREGAWQALACSALFFLLALLSGQGALVLIAVVAVYDLAILTTVSRRRLLWAELCYLAAILFYLVLLPGKGEFLPLPNIYSSRIFSALSALGFYTISIIAPIKQSIIPEPQSSAILVMISMSMPALTLLLFWDNRRVAGMLALVCFLSLLPAAFVLFHGFRYPLGYRYLYMPLSAISILAGLMLDRLRSRQALMTIFALVCISFAGLSLYRTVVWSSPSMIWSDAASRSERFSAAEVNRAASLLLAGRFAEARSSATRAFSKPDMSNTEFHRASKIYLASTGFKDDQSYMDTVSAAASPAKAYYGLGYVYYNEFAKDKRDPRQLEKSRTYLTKALELAPDMAGANYHMGLIHLHLEEVEKAEHYFNFANSVNPEGLFVSDIKYFIEGLSSARARGLIPPKGAMIAQ